MAQLINTTINGSLNVNGNTILKNNLNITSGGNISLQNNTYNLEIASYSTGFQIKPTNVSTSSGIPLIFGLVDGNTGSINRFSSIEFNSDQLKIINPTEYSASYSYETVFSNGNLTLRYNPDPGSGSARIIKISPSDGLQFSRGVCIGGIEGNSAITGSNGIAIGFGASTQAGTNIGAGTQSGERGNYLCLGVGGDIWSYMSGKGGNWQTTSDYRDKTDFLNIESDKALNFINSLQGKTYVYNHRHDYKDENGNFDEVSYLAGTKKHNRRQAGFIAQDTYQSMINIFQDDNYADIVDYSKYDNPDIEEDQYYMAKEALIPFLVEAIKEQQKQIEELKNEIKTMKEL